MKRILYIIGVVLTIVSCTKTDEIVEPTLGDGYVTLSAGSPSKVSADGLEWTGGEEICVVTVKDSKYSYLKYTITNAGTGAMTPSSDSDKIINEGEFTYYAYYPYGDGVQQYNCDLTKSQEPLLAVVGTKSSSEKVSLQFSHKYARLIFNLKTGAVQDLSDATVKVSGAYVKGDYRSTDGTFSNPAKDDLTLTSTKGVATTYIIPTNVWHSIDVVVTAGGSEYATSLSSRLWESGKTYSFDIEVGELIPDLVYNDTEQHFEILNAVGLKGFADLVNGVENTTTAVKWGDSNLSFSTQKQNSIDGVLMYDIDLKDICGADVGVDSSPVNWTPIGSSTYPYTGEFDGNNHKVENLYINGSSLENQALFGAINSTTVKNLSVSGYVSAWYRVGIIAGSVENTTIINCHSSGTATGGKTLVGGVVGGAYTNTIIIASTNKGNIYNSSTNNTGNVGGIAGFTQAGTRIVACYNTGEAKVNTNNSGGNRLGGVVGIANDDVTITACYNSGSVIGYSGSSIGGITGIENSSEDTILTSNYWIDIANNSTTAHGVGGTGSGSYDYYTAEYKSNTNAEKLTTIANLNSKVEDLNSAIATWNSLNINACQYIYQGGADDNTLPTLKLNN